MLVVDVRKGRAELAGARSTLAFAAALLSLAACQPRVNFSDGQGLVPPRAVPAWTTQARFAITNNRSDLMSFVSTSDPIELFGNLPIGDIPVELEGPHHAAASPDGAFIYYNLSNYVPGTGSGPHGSHGLGTVPGSLVKLDARTMENLGEAIVDKDPGDVILSADGRYAYVSHYEVAKYTTVVAMPNGTEEMAYSPLYIVDTSTMQPVSHIPLCVTAHGLGLSADGKTLFATCAFTDQVAVVDVSDAAHPKVSARVPLGPNAARFGEKPVYNPYSLAVSPRDGSVWISDTESHDVRVFDPAKMQMDPARTIFVNGVALFGDFTKDGRTYYVPHQGDDAVTVIDTATLATTIIPLPKEACLNVHMLRIAPDQQSAIIVCEGDHQARLGTAVMLDLRSVPGAPTGFVEVGLFPDGAVWLPPLP